VASGTDAILLALAGSGIKEGDEVITTPFTFVATADMVTALKAIPVFVDIDPATFNLNAGQIEEKITPRTRAIMPVHLYGQSADMDPILAIAAKHALKVIEDNAQAIGATYKGKRTGSIGDVGCLSFFPSKNLGGYGDGGMIVTGDERIAERVRRLRAHGAKKKYFSEEQGYNSRLDEIQAAILRVKLRHLDEWNAKRRANAKRYTALLEAVKGVKPPAEADYGTHVYHQYTIRVSHRDAVQAALKEQEIGSAIYYPTPLHLQPLFSDSGFRPCVFPESECAARQVLSLPMYPELAGDHILQVTAVLQECLR
jgi:dTDP-4-amino-4,6-dideoxygalactose transaminase